MNAKAVFCGKAYNFIILNTGMTELRHSTEFSFGQTQGSIHDP